MNRYVIYAPGNGSKVHEALTKVGRSASDYEHVVSLVTDLSIDGIATIVADATAGGNYLVAEASAAAAGLSPAFTTLAHVLDPSLDEKVGAGSVMV